MPQLPFRSHPPDCCSVWAAPPRRRPPALTIGDSYAVLAASSGITTGRARTATQQSALPDYSGTIVINV